MISGNDISKSGIFDFQVFPLQENVQSLGKGNNQKNILVGLAEEITPELSQFLEKILASVGISAADDVFIIYLTKDQKFSFSQLNQDKNFQKVILFGIKPSTAGLNFDAKPYQPFIFNEKAFLFAHPLSKIQTKAELKRPLWEGLKMVVGE